MNEGATVTCADCDGATFFDGTKTHVSKPMQNTLLTLHAYIHIFQSQSPSSIRYTDSEYHRCTPRKHENGIHSRNVQHIVYPTSI